ncbi:serine/threonine protein kinase PkaE [Luedemannella flava]|uniref:Serine/threonine protein kinase PkaE n=1 Tax=Luedemannella flava TaxID=349316 RepID=A0ABN2LWD1_9ACTN
MSGPLVGGRYEVEDLPERGSMGEVFTAYDLRLDRRVAVKRMHPDLLGDPGAVKRFEREARLTARVSHPGVPRVLDYGLDEYGPYLALEQVNGRTLRDLICEIYPLPVAWVAAIGAQICAVLMHAHAASLIHRDLKPANILLRPDGTIAIIDFGVAAVVGASRLSTLTGSGAMVGTPEYQAPERRLGVESPLTDLYAVGRVLHDLHTGTLPGLVLPRDRVCQTGNNEVQGLIGELSAVRPQDRPSSARVVLDRLLPLVGAPGILPGFVLDPHAIPAQVTAYAAAVVPATGIRSAPPNDKTAGVDVPHLRRRAERLARAERHRQAIDLIDYVIDLVADPHEALNLKWDRARWLFEAGDHRRAADALRDATELMAARLGAVHPAVVSGRLMLAQAMAGNGEAPVAIALLRTLLDDLAADGGAEGQQSFPVRLELGIQLAVVGETDEARTTLEPLAAAQRAELGAHHSDLALTLDALAVL